MPGCARGRRRGSAGEEVVKGGAHGGVDVAALIGGAGVLLGRGKADEADAAG